MSHAQRINKTKDWKVTVVTLGGKRYAYYFDTEEDADAVSVMLYAHGEDIREVNVLPTLAINAPTPAHMGDNN